MVCPGPFLSIEYSVWEIQMDNILQLLSQI